MDALSDLLRVVRLSGGVFLEAEFSAPWCIAAHVGPEDCRLTLAEPRHVIAFHYVTKGPASLQITDESPLELGTDGLALLPRNDFHLLGSDVNLPPADGDALVQIPAEGELARIRYGGGGAVTRMICGFVGADLMPPALLELLPRVLTFDLSGRPEAPYVSHAFRRAAQEVASLRPAAAIALAKLSELIFIEAVRHHVESLPEEARGWLAGLRDEKIGRALALLHRNPERAWSAEALGEAVHMSRSAFTERFTGLVGMPPMSYLGQWRMQVAARKLLDERGAVARIAADVGYESEAAFSRAFKREFGVSPRAWRTQNATGSAASTEASRVPVADDGPVRSRHAPEQRS